VGLRHQEQAIDIGNISVLPDGASRGFDHLGQGRDTIFIVRKGSRIFAYFNDCPHVESAPLAWRKDEYLNKGKTHIICHGHGAEFTIDDGYCVLGPCIGKSLKEIKVDVSQGGQIFLNL
jgi:nitrite reductase/ring-hydroxylating ferredoxin subunit